jgi:hypothetical protein
MKVVDGLKGMARRLWPARRAVVAGEQGTQLASSGPSPAAANATAARVSAMPLCSQHVDFATFDLPHAAEDADYTSLLAFPACTDRLPPPPANLTHLPLSWTATAPLAMNAYPSRTYNTLSLIPTEGQWTPELQQHLHQALEGEPFGDLITSFKQTNAGNCITTSVIKASMAALGNRVLADVRPYPGCGDILVTQRNGERLILSPQDMDVAASFCRYAGEPSPTKAYAILCYGVAAKQAAHHGYKGARDFIGGAVSLNSWSYPEHAVKFLGVEEAVHPLPAGEPITGPAFAWSSRHGIYVGADGSAGHLRSDAHGTPQAYDGTDTVGNNIEHVCLMRP